MQDKSERRDVSEGDSIRNPKGVHPALTGTSEDTDNSPAPEQIFGNGSVAHQIIGQFVRELGAEERYADIAQKLGAVIFVGKPTESDLKAALFGESDL